MANFIDNLSRSTFILAAGLLLIAPLHVSAETIAAPRTVFSADSDWKFEIGDPAGARRRRSTIMRGALFRCRMTGASKELPMKRTPPERVVDIFPPASVGTGRASRLPKLEGEAGQSGIRWRLIERYRLSQRTQGWLASLCLYQLPLRHYIVAEPIGAKCHRRAGRQLRATQ